MANVYVLTRHAPWTDLGQSLHRSRRRAVRVGLFQMRSLSLRQWHRVIPPSTLDRCAGHCVRVEPPPATVENSLEPGAEIHSRPRRNPYTAQISLGVTCGNIEASAEYDSQMLEIPTDSEAFVISLQRTLTRPGVLVHERDVVVHPIAYGLNASPTWRQVTE